MVATDGSLESPRLSPSVDVVGRQSSGQLRRQNCRPAGAIKSALRFNGTSGIAAKAIYLIALVCMAISLGRVLIDPSLGGAIAIVYGDRKSVAADDCGGSATT